MTVRVLRVLNTEEMTIMLGDKVYNIEADKQALIDALQGGCYVTSPLAAVTPALDTTLFHWLLNNNVDMTKVLVTQLRCINALLKGAKVKPARGRRALSESAAPTEFTLTADEVEFAALVRNALSAMYKLYYNQERDTYKAIESDVLKKKAELLDAFNKKCGTDYTCLRNSEILGVRKREDLTDDEVLQIRKVYRQYRKLTRYTAIGPESVINIIADRRVCLWHDAVKIKRLVAGATDCSLTKNKYWSVEMFGIFMEARFYSGQATNDYLSDTLGIPNVDCTKGMIELRNQYPDVPHIIGKYCSEVYKLEKIQSFDEYGYALAKFVNEVLAGISEAGHTAYVIDISQSVTFAFSNRTSIPKVAEALRRALINNPEIARLFEATSVNLAGTKLYAPIAGLYRDKDYVQDRKSRNCAADFYEYMLR